MENEAKMILLDRLKSAYKGLRESGGNTYAALTESVDPLLSGLSEEDRQALSNSLYQAHVKRVLEHAQPEEPGDYLGLAWRIWPWSTGS